MSKKVKYRYIPNYVNIENFNIRRKSHGMIVIGTIANFKPQKNPLMWAKVALEVTSKFKNVIFVYIGDGPLRKRVENMVLKNKRIKILGWKNNIAKILEEMDIFFLPSRWEGLPLSVLEAMASGLPVIASRVDGTTEAVLDSVTGHLLPPDDFNGYVEKISELIQDGKKRREMGKKGRERAKKSFSYKRMIERNFSLYESLGLT